MVYFSCTCIFVCILKSSYVHLIIFNYGTLYTVYFTGYLHISKESWFLMYKERIHAYKSFDYFLPSICFLMCTIPLQLMSETHITCKNIAKL